MYLCISADIPSYCLAHPGSILPHPTNCAQYYRCPVSKYSSTVQEECQYPDLFSTIAKACQNFTSVACETRPEPQAPCKSTDKMVMVRKPKTIHQKL